MITDVIVVPGTVGALHLCEPVVGEFGLGLAMRLEPQARIAIDGPGRAGVWHLVVSATTAAARRNARCGSFSAEIVGGRSEFVAPPGRAHAPLRRNTSASWAKVRASCSS